MYALIGDVVGSRRIRDRTGAQRRIAAALEDVEGALAGLQPLQATVGDELQGAYPSLGDASRAALLIRLALLPDVDVRCGIGFGETTVFDGDRTPLLQDGPAWWAAREALDSMAAPRRAGVRTWFAGPDAELANAHLLCRDALVDRLSERGWRMLRLSLRGETQQRIAELEGISKSAVSQQFARGIAAVRDAQDLLRKDP
jgi:DNA-binding CsgD family transcriptional regulator